MAPRPSPLAIKLAAEDGDLCLLKEMATQMDLREAKDPVEGANALHFTAFKGRLEVCRFLVEESGFDVNSTAADDRTPVTYAAAGGKVSALRYLLDHGGDPAVADATGATPLYYAAEKGHHKTARLLLSRGVHVDAPCRGQSPLQLAAENGHDRAVKVLLEHGADPNRVAHNMFSPLTDACYGRSLSCIKLLVEAGADVNLKPLYGLSALMLASHLGLADIVNFLLEAGADPNVSGNISGKVKGKEHIMADAKTRGNEAFAKGDYLAASLLYDMAILKDPLDATLFSNKSLCWLRLGDGKHALLAAQKCKTLRPRWLKAWYREGAALSLLKDYEGAVNAFTEALKLEPTNYEIKKALREATDSLMNAGGSGDQNP